MTTKPFIVACPLFAECLYIEVETAEKAAQAAAQMCSDHASEVGGIYHVYPLQIGTDGLLAMNNGEAFEADESGNLKGY